MSTPGIAGSGENLLGLPGNTAMDTSGDKWWRDKPKAYGIEVTDVCSDCGHCRDRHDTKRVPFGTVKRTCLVKGCVCGPKLTSFHVAGWVGPLDTHTMEDGKQITLSQPAAPRKLK
jgi:hypothetical protein